MGGLFERGRSIVRDMDEAVHLYAKACAMGDMTGCNNVGHMYKLGRGVPRDDAKASTYFKRACDAGLPLGCKNLKHANAADEGAGSAGSTRGR
jgi:hypothetical protein